jgi:hypothetical protein
MQKKKEFSVLKWIVFPLNSVVLAGIIAWFNLSVFGYRDGLPYTLIVALIGVFSILINRYTESNNRSLAKAAFVFEIVLTAALIVNACYSVSVQRKMSVARMAESSQAMTIEQIGKLRGSKTQQKALDKIDKQESAQSVFADVENILFWIMVGELGLYGLSAFTLFALAKLVDEKEDEPREIKEEFPEELNVENRLPARRENFTKKKETERGMPLSNPEGLKKLREALKDISFRLAGFSFKAQVRGDAVWIYMVMANQGTQETIASAKAKLSILDDAVRLSREVFRERLEKFLEENGFEIRATIAASQ